MTRDESTPPATLEYSNPARMIRLSPVPALLAYGVVYAVIALLSFVAMPRIEQYWKDMKMPLPQISQLLMRFCRWFRGDLGWLMLLPVPIVVPVALSRRVMPAGTPRRRRVFGVAGILLALVVIFVGYAVILPYVTLIDSLSSPGKTP